MKDELILTAPIKYVSGSMVNCETQELMDSMLNLCMANITT